MKILVGYKRVVDYNVRIQVKPDGSGVVTDGVKLSPNPFDDIALEEALRLRDAGIASEVVVASIAPADAQPHLRNGLAMGANRAIHVVADAAIQPLTAARALLKLIEKEQPDLVLLGKQAIDDDANQTGQMLATLWGRPQATFASKLTIADGKATVVREVDAGLVGQHPVEHHQIRQRLIHDIAGVEHRMRHLDGVTGVPAVQRHQLGDSGFVFNDEDGGRHAEAG